MKPADFHARVIQPTLGHLGLRSDGAERLLLGTAMTESRLWHLVQMNGGPALGVYQVEPATHDDIRRYLLHRRRLGSLVDSLLAPWPTPETQLITNLAYATAIARVIYWRKPEPLPTVDDIPGLAAYWKLHFNTPAGHGQTAHFIQALGRTQTSS